jgi:hypothetical protein
MKITLLTSLCSAAMLLGAFAQEPPVPPEATPGDPALEAPAPAATPATAPAAPAAPAAATPLPPGAAAAATATPPRTIDADEDEDNLERQIERKVRRGVSITIDRANDRADRHIERAERRAERRAQRGSSGIDIDRGADLAVPIVAVIFTTLFGAPIVIVAVIMFFSYLKARSLHRTVRMMVERGQPVPEALFAATPPRATTARQRHDMRRGVVLVAIGAGIMLFFAAIGAGGVWAMGLIPLLIGAGYLALWQLDAQKYGAQSTSTDSTTFDNNTGTENRGTDNPPPLP